MPTGDNRFKQPIEQTLNRRLVIPHCGRLSKTTAVNDRSQDAYSSEATAIV
jgi:hypothetical protein